MDILKLQQGFDNEKIIIIPHPIIDQYLHLPTIHNLIITDIGFFPSAKFHYRERKEGVEEYILILCTKGKGVVCFDDQDFSLIQRDLIIIPAHAPHLYYSDHTDPWDIFWVHFKGVTPQYFLRNHQFHDIITFDIDTFRLVNLLFFDLLNVLERGLTENHLAYASQCLAHILSLILLDHSNISKIQSNKSAYIAQATLYMKQHINQNLSLDDIASSVGLSRSYLSLIFKEETGYAPIDYFVHLKIQTSCSMLKYSDLSIKAIANHIGYEEQYYFSRVFKKLMGISPLQYRNNP